MKLILLSLVCLSTTTACSGNQFREHLWKGSGHNLGGLRPTNYEPVSSGWKSNEEMYKEWDKMPLDGNGVVDIYDHKGNKIGSAKAR